MLCHYLEEWDQRGREVHEGGYIYISMADLSFMAERNTTLKSNYPPNKK